MVLLNLNKTKDFHFKRIDKKLYLIAKKTFSETNSQIKKRTIDNQRITLVFQCQQTCEFQ